MHRVLYEYELCFGVCQYCEAFANVLVGNLDGGVIRYLLLLADLISRVQFPTQPHAASALPDAKRFAPPSLHTAHSSDYTTSTLLLLLLLLSLTQHFVYFVDSVAIVL